MKVSSLVVKCALSSVLFLVLAYGYRVYHDPWRRLEEKKSLFDAAVANFASKVQSVQASSVFLKNTREANQGMLMGDKAQELIDLLRSLHLDLIAYQHQEIRFWSTNVGELAGLGAYPVGLSINKTKTGWFLVNKVESGYQAYLFFIPLRYQYEFPNQYLKNDFSQSLRIGPSFTLSATSSGFSLPLVSPRQKRVLAYLTLEPTQFRLSMDGFELLLLLALLGLSFYIIKTGCDVFVGSKLQLFSFFIGLIASGAILLWFSWYFNQMPFSPTSFFKPALYSDPPFFYTLGQFGLYLAYFIWLVWFSSKSFPRTNTPLENRRGAQVLIFLALLGCLFLFTFLFQSLITRSNIPLDLTNIFNLNRLTLSVLGLMACTWLAYYYALSKLGRSFQSLFSTKEKATALGVLAALYGLFSFFLWPNFHLFSLAVAIIAAGFLMLPRYVHPLIKLSFGLIFISLISSFQINRLNTERNRQRKIAFARALANSSDPVTENLLTDIGVDIAADPELAELIAGPGKRPSGKLNQEIQKAYFERNFPNYDVQTYLFSPQGFFLIGPEMISLEVFNATARNPGTRRISDYFYQAPGKLGLNNYFSIIPYRAKGAGKILGILVVRVNARFIRENNTFPELLLDQKDLTKENSSIYSYAFYKDGRLIDKYGKYPYSIEPAEFLPLNIKDSLVDREINRFNHLIYQPVLGELILVSEPAMGFYTQGATFSYVLGFFLLFFGAAALLVYIYGQFAHIKDITHLLNELKSARLLYKTRIQVSIVGSVVLSLIVIGWITLAFVHNQYNLQQVDLLKDQLNNLREVFERELPTDSLTRQSDKSNRLFLDFAAGHSQDLNLYNTQGNLVYSSLSKLFERGLLSQQMNPKAFLQMFVLGRTEFVHAETIGTLTFLSGYSPIRNNFNQVVGYLNLPYFANQMELRRRLSGFSNSLINVYLTMLFLIGVFALVLANSLTSPLSLVQKSIGSTKIGNLNQPIAWKRDDEIGDLIAEYNRMILTIEESAARLAKSERESAWREMAKQVAHEIKNPLTPLKLGIQHLERSWKEKDPQFDAKFNRFSKTFIEQIDSLSAISTEFSHFAQMPIAQETNVDLVEVVEQVIHLLSAEDHVTIHLEAEEGIDRMIFADRDQLSRAFTNLIKNSIQSIPEGTPGNIRVLIQAKGLRILVTIIDNGMGIARGLYPKIFQPNFTTKGSGTGLGLAFVKKVVDQTGGTITFVSTEGQGTTFFIEFPRGLK